MYYLQKRLEISASHHLHLDYESPCRRIHGHNWIIVVYLKSEKLDEKGMIADFSMISRFIKDSFDHKNLNTVLEVNPTAENIAHWIVTHIENCYKCDVQETEGSLASYEL